MEEKKANRLIKALEKYNNHTNEVTDAIYEYIDGEREKVGLCEIMDKHKELLQRLESILKNI